MADTGMPQLYDEDQGFRAIARARLKRDDLTVHQVAIADRLALQMQRHFSADETETIGRALLIGAASCAALANDEIPATVILNIIAFAAGHLIADGRAWLEAQGGGNG